MNLRAHIASLTLLLAVHAAPVAAQEPLKSLPTVPVQGIYYVTDCDHRVLPSQRQIGELTGQSNFSQVYDTRRQLMADIGRACHRAGVERVNLVLQRNTIRAGAPTLLVAQVEPGAGR
jgi:hypothetical protein